MSGASGLPKGITVLGIARAFQKVLLFAQFWVFVRTYGAGPDTDALIMAQTLPVFFVGLFTRGMTQTFLPVFAEWREQRGLEQAWELAATLLLATLGLIALLVPLVLVAAPAIMWALAPGLSAEYRLLGSELLRWLSIVIALGGLVGVPQAIYFSYRDFAIPSIASLFQPLLTTLAILLLADRFGVYAVVIGLVTGAFLQLSLLVALLNFRKQRFKPSLTFCRSGLTRFSFVMSGRIGMMLIGHGIAIVDRVFASMTGAGGITLLVYAGRLAHSPLELFNASFGTAILAQQSDDVGRGDMEGFRERILSCSRYAVFLIAPMTVSLFLLARPILMLFFSEASQGEALDTAVPVLRAYCIGVLPLAISSTLRGSLIAMQDMRLTLPLGLFNFTLNIALNFLLIGPFGLLGLAAGTSLSAVIDLLVLTRITRRRFGRLEYSRLLGPAIRVAGASAVTGLVLYVLCQSLDIAGRPELLSLVTGLITATTGACLTYLAACRLFGVTEADFLFQKLRRKWNRLANSRPTREHNS
ncbi:MurJ-like flippase [Maioricimonas rarisocia]|uniref:MurJ-like flippase n=1 Tax=Maioricimonas rarisocia TaxID=2528026 RepID=A0A517ZD71_9PLAN|nr:lipid II flippase MurJ [Maioricimonas rarisocia]QDU40412.1 MurJ-like flippase [Maioricimonas rarisocia]